LPPTDIAHTASKTMRVNFVPASLFLDAPISVSVWA
jgi:hypothetical protein